MLTKLQIQIRQLADKSQINLKLQFSKLLNFDICHLFEIWNL